MAEMTGGCQCGRVRYRVRVDDETAYLCHCRMCQRATGGVFAAFKNVARGGLVWEGPEPDRYESSPIARRGFCARCGTPLTYEGRGKPNLDLTVGSFDESHRLHPIEHAGVESWHEDWLDTRGLPGERTADNARLVEQWVRAVGKFPG